MQLKSFLNYRPCALASPASANLIFCSSLGGVSGPGGFVKSTVDARRTVGWIASLGLAAVTMLVAPQAHATSLPLGTASDYAVLFEGFCGHTVQIGSNVTINGNIGVGGGPASGFGNVHNSGPSTITGRVDFVPAGGLSPGAAPG